MPRSIQVDIYLLSHDKKCVNCGSTTTRMACDKRRNNRIIERWRYIWENDQVVGMLCYACDDRINWQERRQEYFKEARKKRIKYKGKTTYTGINQKTGVCSWCNKKIGDTFIDRFGKTKTIQYMHTHHLEYHDDNILKDTIEICPQCHGKETYSNPIPESKINS